MWHPFVNRWKTGTKTPYGYLVIYFSGHNIEFWWLEPTRTWPKAKSDCAFGERFYNSIYFFVWHPFVNPWKTEVNIPYIYLVIYFPAPLGQFSCLQLNFRHVDFELRSAVLVQFGRIFPAEPTWWLPNRKEMKTNDAKWFRKTGNVVWEALYRISYVWAKTISGRKFDDFWDFLYPQTLWSPMSPIRRFGMGQRLIIGHFEWVGTVSSTGCHRIIPKTHQNRTKSLSQNGLRNILLRGTIGTLCAISVHFLGWEGT